VIDRGRDVGGFGARRDRRADHRFEHLRRDDHGLPLAPALAHDPALDRRHLLRRELDAEVAAGNHHRIGLRDDRIEMLDGGRLFQLRENPRTAPGKRARLVEILGPLHERQRQPLDAQRQRELEIAPVLFGKRRQRQHDIRHVDALALR
jgi:hypothetical protein